MKKFNFLLITALAFTTVFTGCKKDKEEAPAPQAVVEYKNAFKTSAGDTTVDRTEGQIRLKMLKALDAYAKTGNSGKTALNADVLKNLFSNTNSPFTEQALNQSGLALSNATATSVSYTADVKSDIESFFVSHANASKSIADTAAKGKAGKLFAGTSVYLVDEKGIEWAQVISKSFIGAFQLDYISNVLLNTGLSANNNTLVQGKNYTALEHNWDVAYGILTLNDVYGAGGSGNPSVKPTSESFLGSYVWEYNKSGFDKMFPAFLNGRKAIVKKDIETTKEQAFIIRNAMEMAIANAAIGYLGKWKSSTTDAARAHAIGEGTGFIYSLRFCKLNGADDAFSDKLLDDLIFSSEYGFWSLNADKVNAASDAIKAKFNIQ